MGRWLVETAATWKPVVEVLGALSTPVLAAAIGYIAYQQWRTNARREQRESRAAKLAIYRSIKRFLVATLIERDSSRGPLDDLDASLAEADFLLGRGLVVFLGGLRSVGSTLVRLEAELAGFWHGREPVGSRADGAPIFDEADHAAYDAIKVQVEQARAKLSEFSAELLELFEPELRDRS